VPAPHQMPKCLPVKLTERGEVGWRWTLDRKVPPTVKELNDARVAAAVAAKAAVKNRQREFEDRRKRELEEQRSRTAPGGGWRPASAPVRRPLAQVNGVGIYREDAATRHVGGGSVLVHPGAAWAPPPAPPMSEAERLAAKVGAKERESKVGAFTATSHACYAQGGYKAKRGLADVARARHVHRMPLTQATRVYNALDDMAGTIRLPTFQGIRAARGAHGCGAVKQTRADTPRRGWKKAGTA
jgi:hypothetical protein